MKKKERKARELICEIGRRIYARGMVAANDGNITVKLAEDLFLCTPTGVSKGFMTPESLCLINGRGEVIDDAANRPSSEVKMHLRVYERRADVRAVVHAHPPYATCFAACETPLAEPVLTEAVVSLGCVPLAPYATPSTEEVPDSIEPYLPYFEAVLLSHHGALTWGTDLMSAWQRMESVEYYAMQLTRLRQMGGSHRIDAAQVEKLHALRAAAHGGTDPMAGFCHHDGSGGCTNCPMAH
jgi:L-fuculose-phosphate aldolase